MLDIRSEATRVCSICGRPMYTGYCYDSGLAYYCSEDCLHHDFTPEEWEQECAENEDSYWTDWR